MTKWARKDENGKVVEVIDFDPTDKFHTSIVWEEVSDSTEVSSDNGITPENNEAAKAEEARRLQELEALNNPATEE